MNEIGKYLNTRRRGGQAQFNVSVKQHRQQEVTDAFAYLLRKLSPLSKSSIACDAIVQYAENLRSEERPPDSF